MGGACRLHGKLRSVSKFWLESLKGGDHLEEQDTDWDNIKMDVRKMGFGVSI
jgi:hypothetical protein